jgi:hypothetical protein
MWESSGEPSTAKARSLLRASPSPGRPGPMGTASTRARRLSKRFTSPPMSPAAWPRIGRSIALPWKARSR